MPLSKNLNTYYDVAQVLTTLRKQGGGFYDFAQPGVPEAKAHGRAMMWRSRAYYYRTLLAQAARQRLGNYPGFVAETDWDDMFLTVIGTKVKVEFGKLIGALTSLSGTPVDPEAIPVHRAEKPSLVQAPEEPLGVDDLEAEALALAAKLDGKDE